ncbi:hypothetical protein Q1695_015579 [Nippostrongylus brasiliensis]|nr:hypothetical protein Q1695_015579 [Nippostrongylus brasiliensis]
MDALPGLLQAIQEQLTAHAKRMDEQGKALELLMEKMSSYKEDAELLEGIPSVNAVRRRNFYHRKKKMSQRHQPDESPSRAFPKQPQKVPKKSTRPTSHHARNRQISRIVAALQKDDHPQLEVTINGRPIQLLLDTGAEITVISELNWINLAKPTLQQTDLTVYAANGTLLKIHGCFDTDFAVSCSTGEHCVGRGKCFVTKDNCNVFGMAWIKQLPDLYKAVRKYQICSTIVVDHAAASREVTVAKLKTDFADVFQPGLGRCTMTKATLMLKANTQPVFKRKRPVPYATIEALNSEIDRLLH